MRHTKKKIKLDKYSGKWVALLGGRVVENGKNLKQLDEKDGKERYKRESLYILRS